MGGIKLEVTGDLRPLLEKYASSVDEAATEAAKVTALDVMATAKKSIQRGTKTGRIYVTSYDKDTGLTTVFGSAGRVAVFKGQSANRVHQASAPGEAPASDTGELAGSITMEKVGKKAFEVGTLLDYGRYLEYGTTKIEERPWLRPAIDINREAFLERIKSALKGAASLDKNLTPET